MQNIEISKIHVDTEKRRKVKDVSALVKSIKTLGLLNPITITTQNVLVAGAHRLAACVKLEWDTIPAIVLDLSPERTELAEIDENLVRNQLNELEKGEQIARRKELYELIYPGTTKKEIAKANRTGCGSELISFSKDTAQKTGLSMRTIQQKTQFATKIPKDLRDEIRDMPIADSKKDLLALSRRNPEEQRTLVDLLKSNSTKNIANGISYLRLKEKHSQPEPGEAIEGEDFIFSSTIQCGDYQDIIKTYPDGSVNLVLTDPPYNQNKAPWDRDFDPRPMMPEIYRILADNGSALIFCSDVLLPTYIANTGGLKLRQFIHWHKSNPDTSPLDGKHGIFRYLDSMEYILWFTKTDEFTFNPEKIDTDMCGKAKKNCFITGICNGNERIKGDDGKALHSCQKPVELIESLLLTHSNRGDRVVDLFVGSGTTPVLATKWGRSFWGTEQDPEHYDVALKRAMFPLGGYPEMSDNYDDLEEMVS
jgi:ParB family transcriptional regulator, chromosome partitioning protein